ncbi:TBCC-domain-containing protein [Coprinellus micaceus]|uniref:TBCC-domain-containing protein n=1 Tax=Coprinellus micaceus TaxID=71717 RepID=A0A4Y7SYV9_COPMI|nr:TBCC-domain-containing protein [Coprinellus micaceus]
MASQSNDENTWTFSQKFTAEFQASRLDLETRIAAFTAVPPTSSNIEDLSTRLAKLSKSLSDAATSLPSYDQRLYSAQVKSIEEKVEAFRTAAKPKLRFAFKRKVVADPVAPPPIASTTAPLGGLVTPNESPAGSSSEGKTRNLPNPELVSLPKGLELSNHSKRYLTWADLPLSVTPNSAPDLAISNLNRCIVNLLPQTDGRSKFSALHIRDLSDCVLLLPLNEGSALIHDVKNCVLVLGCHQFRMHTSTHADVYLHITSKPIIETCSNIRFATYPARLAPQLLHELPQSPFTVQDFSHIRATPSPNFSLIGGKLGAEIRPWPIDPISNGEEMASALVTLLPKTSVAA